jgi:hypothetical protein
MPDDDVAVRLVRWTRAGGAWRVDPAPGGRVRVALLRCDGGEEVDHLVCDAHDVPTDLGRSS